MNKEIELVDYLIKKISIIDLPVHRDFYKAYEKTKLYIENFSKSKKEYLLRKLEFTRGRRLKKTHPKRAIRKEKRKNNIISQRVDVDILLTRKMNSIIDILKLLKDELEVSIIEGYSIDQEKIIVNFEYIDDLEIKEEIINRYLQIFKLASSGMYKLGLILMGSIIEQLLKTYYNLSAKTSDLINKARTDNIISKADKSFLEMLNHMRNYIHIEEYLKSKDKIDESRFKGTVEIFESFLLKIKGLFINKK